MALASLIAISGPKKSRFSGPTLSNAPSNDAACLKAIKYKPHINNRYIGNFMYTGVVALLCVVVCREGGEVSFYVVWRY